MYVAVVTPLPSLPPHPTRTCIIAHFNYKSLQVSQIPAEYLTLIALHSAESLFLLCKIIILSNYKTMVMGSIFLHKYNRIICWVSCWMSFSCEIKSGGGRGTRARLVTVDIFILNSECWIGHSASSNWKGGFSDQMISWLAPSSSSTLHSCPRRPGCCRDITFWFIIQKRVRHTQSRQIYSVRVCV